MQTDLAVGHEFPGEKYDPPDQSAKLRVAGHGLGTRDRLLRFRRAVLLRFRRQGALAPRPGQTEAYLGQWRIADPPWRSLHPELRPRSTDISHRRGQENRQNRLAGGRTQRRFGRGKTRSEERRVGKE